LRNGRKPKQIYVDNDTQFISLAFKKIAKDNSMKLIYDRPYRPRGRGKIDHYHKAMHQELIAAKTFASLSGYRSELWKSNLSYNYWRKQEPWGWKTPC
jgi:putative transposase